MLPSSPCRGSASEASVDRELVHARKLHEACAVLLHAGLGIDEALKAIAEKAGGKVEWWVEGQTVNVCRCEHGEEITLGYGKGLTSLERDTSNTAKFYTRLFPVGSTRNIDAEKYGSPRLMLPGGRKYIEQGVEEYGIYDHYEQDAFSGIFPRRVGTVSSVRSEEVADDEGNKYTVLHFGPTFNGVMEKQ